ncbi:MAG: hypothetical protein HC888_07280 [Candidatus Competibacteraceae bacterium]|nr:hypothetical protein [Candidatus Competibacteraceae bacterium]
MQQCNDEDAKAYYLDHKGNWVCPICKIGDRAIDLLTQYKVTGRARVDGSSFRDEEGILHVSGRFYFDEIETCKQ